MRLIIFVLCAVSFLAAQPGRDMSMLTDGKLHVIVCGSGSPLPDAERAGACVAVIAGGQVILIDAGPGSFRKANIARVPDQALSTVLLTHFHSDHIGDLGEAMTMSWVNGRTAPLDVYGPPGVERVVRGFTEVYELDAQYRILHHGETALPPKAHGMIAHAIAVGPTERKLLFEKNGVSVYAFAVDHRPIEPAYGYRIEYRGRSVVISGDTVYSPNLVRHAAGADLLLHDAMLKNFITLAAAGMSTQGQPRTAQMLRDILGYHASAADAAKAAAEAHVETLVLTHLVPVPSAVGGDSAFIKGAGDVFKGKLVVAHDGLRFDLDPRVE